MSLTLAAATAIGAGLSFVGGLAANGLNSRIARENIDYQKDANSQNLSLIDRMNSQNIAFQQRENEITRSREDNAIQRAAADMQAAGLSKTLAAGNPASAAAQTAPSVQSGSVKALNNQFKYESALQKMNLGSLFLDMASKEQQLEINRDLADAQITSYGADAYLKYAQAAGQNLSNDTYMDKFNADLAFTFADTQYRKDMSAKVQAETELVKTQGKFEAARISSQIAVNCSQVLSNFSQRDVNVKVIEKYAQDISESIAREKKLSKEEEELVKKIAYAELQNQALEHNIEIAKENGYPTGVWPTNLLSYVDRTGRGTVDGIFGTGSFNFGLPQIIGDLTDEGNKKFRNPEKISRINDFFDIFRFGR